MAVIVVIGSLSSCVMFQPRIEYAMAKDGLFFKAFGKVHPKYETPAFSIVVQCAIGTGLPVYYFWEKKNKQQAA